MARRVFFKYSDDATMVAQVLDGNELAISYMFYDHYRPLLLANYRRTALNKQVDFEDLLQELFLYVSENNWERLRRYNPEMPFVNWFSVVSYRFFKNFSSPMIDSASSDAISSVEGQTVDGGFNILLMDLIRILARFRPPRDRQILKALLLEDEAPETVAKRHDVTVDNLYNIKRRALARLIKKYLKDYAR